VFENHQSNQTRMQEMDYRNHIAWSTLFGKDYDIY